ncbi:hypothetical protein P2H44_20580 [Albimonas sp. CAU 1670]|uniref:hypothetical protein n=1 Tax=Albimonas sp. CAU 1670 TaxID=3032599 RepID=UPI0023DA045C|nr:hypothetical protein [Albimonas sp. CAU 1670]MDF2234963.1 hypothetical protein [Albimonas sp. CAU 1670]
MVETKKLNLQTAAMEVLSHYYIRDASIGFSEALEHHLNVPYDDPEEFCIIPKYICKTISESWRSYRDGESKSLNEAFSQGLPAKRSPRRALIEVYNRLYLAQMILDHLTLSSARGTPLSIADAIAWAEEELRDEPIEASEKTLWEAWKAVGPVLEERLRANAAGTEIAFTPPWMPNWRD